MSGLDNSQYISAHDLVTAQSQGSTGDCPNTLKIPNNFQTVGSNSELPLHSDRALLPRPHSGNVCFNRGGGQCPLNFAIEDGVSNEERDADEEEEEEGYEAEEEYDELVETPLNSQIRRSDSATLEDVTGPNPAELHAFYVVRAQQLQELADPLTIAAVPEADLLEIMTRAMQSLRRRHLL